MAAGEIILPIVAGDTTYLGRFWSDDGTLTGNLTPIQTVSPALSGKTPVGATFTATGTSAAFTPVAGKGIWITLKGTWVGTVIVERSIDAGVTWLPLTAAGSSYGSFTANAQEVVAQEDEPGVATYRLRCTAYTSGTITYRLGHS